ncbi:MAG: peptide ABC transporter substrate-binding protein, partial [Gemmatimonadetes bacterium]|nr:peptide ABC transporter substrate-binding protein [Gemmatimonadota bacterium]
MARSLAVRIVIGCVFIVAACGRSGATGGTLIVGAPTDPKKLFPPLYDEATGQAISEVVYDKLADIGPALNTVGDAGYQPRLAERWEWSRDSLQITFHLDPRARWHDGAPVTAEDVRFALSVYLDPAVASPKASELADELDSITVRDSLTAVAWYKRRSAEQFHELVNNLVPLPAHLLRAIPRDSLATSGAVRALVGSGPFRLVRWEDGQFIELAATPDFYRGRAALDRVVFEIVKEPTTTFAKLYGGELDVVDQFPASEVAELRKHAALRLERAASFFYGYVAFNLYDGASGRPHPVFGDRGVRRALTMALDRDAMARSVFGEVGVAAAGPLTRSQWGYDPSLPSIPFDRAGAARALDSLGWHVGPDGVRTKGGRRLAFTLLVPATSKPRLQMATLMQDQWKQVGVALDVSSLDPSALGPMVVKHEFDAFAGSFHVSPSPSGLRKTWGELPEAGSGYNPGRYGSPAFLAQVDSGIGAFQIPEAKRHFKAALETVIADAPGIWLYEAPNLVAIAGRVRTPPLRPDAWWSNLERWSFAPGAA